MSAFYIMRYHGQARADGGFGAIYIGHGKIAGVDVGNGRYIGSYTETNGRVRGTVNLSNPSGSTLVTGEHLPAGASIPMTFDWPVNFTGPQTISVHGRQVSITFEKVSDLP